VVRYVNPQPLQGTPAAGSAEYAGTCTASYRFTFQGQEHDDELNGSAGTSYAFEYRMHDARVGRFLSIDPLAFMFPWNSPYAFSENRVLDMVELEGLEAADTPDKEALKSSEEKAAGMMDDHLSSVSGERPTNFMDDDASAGASAPATTPRLPSPKPGVGGLRGPTISQGRPNYALSYKAATLSPQANDAFKVAGDFANAGGLLMTTTQHSLLHSAANTQFRYGAAKTTGRLTSVSNSTLTRATKIQLTSASNVAKTLGRGFGIFGAGLTTIQSVADGNYTLGDFTKTSVGLVTTFTPYGWVYGAVDLGFSIYSGKSF
jgi:RHS repeat-associated protein